MKTIELKKGLSYCTPKVKTITFVQDGILCRSTNSFDLLKDTFSEEEDW